MSDIFISYARDDSDKLQDLATVLADKGWSVWSDNQLAGGDVFSEEIEKEIATASVVIVAWSVSSLKSKWVVDEAEIGRDSGKLLPISLDGSAPPLGFRQYQAIDFGGWAGGSEHSSIVELERSIHRMMDKATPVGPAAAVAVPHQRSPGVHVSPKALTFALAVAAVVALAIGLTTWLSPADHSRNIETGEAARDRPAVIAVLPFRNLSQDEDQTYLADGIAFEIIFNLQRYRHFPVISQSSSFSFRNQDIDVREVAAKLGADYLIEGSILTSGDRLKVSAQLTKATTGHVVWSNQYDSRFIDIFEVQSDVSRSVAAAISPEIEKLEKNRVAQSTAENASAYDLYLRGIRLSRAEDFADVLKAQSLLQQAHELDPGFAPVLVELAWIEHDLITYHFGETTFERSRQARDNALALADEARRRDPQLSEAHMAYGHMLLHFDKPEEALASLRKGMSLNSTSSDNHANLAWGLVHNGDTKGAVEHYNIAKTLNPNDPQVWEFYSNAAYTYLVMGDYAEAAKNAKASLSMNRENYFAIMALLSAQLRSGDQAAAAETFEDFKRYNINFATPALDLTSLPRGLIDQFKQDLFALGWVDPEAPSQ